MESGNGNTPQSPLQTIQYAVDYAWKPGDTIFVMNGVYQNVDYGSGSLNNNSVVYLNGNKVKGEKAARVTIDN